MKLLSAICLGAMLCGCTGRTSPADWKVQPATNCKDKNLWAQSLDPVLLTSPKTHLIFFGNWWVLDNLGQQADQLSQEWQVLANDPNFYLPMAQYGIGAGSLDGIFYTDWNLPDTSVSDTAIQKELETEISDKDLPAPDSQSIYLFLLPPNTHAAFDNYPVYGGYHSYDTAIGAVYAMVEYGDNNTMSVVSSHEIAEASTNPDTSTGYWTGNGDTEIGDYCVGHTYNLDGYVIQQLWSQQKCACEPQ